MRVIAGTARSIPLKTLPGMDTRPTTDKIKETLFNMLQFDLYGVTFLDIFAGSGAIGIEALSRGAGKAVFVEKSRAAVGIIEENIRKCRFTGLSRIVRTDAARVSSYLPASYIEDRLMVFMDPPYGKDLEMPVLKELLRLGALKDDTLIILEEARNFDTSGITGLGLNVTRVKEYRNQKHIFIRKD